MSEKTNPWRSIPAADYEGHMRHPTVGQLAFLADRTAAAAKRTKPAEVCVLGCATGNGFDRLGDRVERLVGVDLNAEYLEIARERHGRTFGELELVCGDLLECDFSERPFDLIVAALVFEYVCVEKALERVSSWLAPDGELLVVSQLPGKAAVSDTGFESLKSLEPLMRFVDPRALKRRALRLGLAPRREITHTLRSGKRFWECCFFAMVD